MVALPDAISEGEKVITSPDTAAVTTARRDPAPELLVLVTTPAWTLFRKKNPQKSRKNDLKRCLLCESGRLESASCTLIFAEELACNEMVFIVGNICRFFSAKLTLKPEYFCGFRVNCTDGSS